MLYLGIKPASLPAEVAHHTILLAKDYARNIREISGGDPLGGAFDLPAARRLHRRWHGAAGRHQPLRAGAGAKPARPASIGIRSERTLPRPDPRPSQADRSARHSRTHPCTNASSIRVTGATGIRGLPRRDLQPFARPAADALLPAAQSLRPWPLPRRRRHASGVGFAGHLRGRTHHRSPAPGRLWRGPARHRRLFWAASVPRRSHAVEPVLDTMMARETARGRGTMNVHAMPSWHPAHRRRRRRPRRPWLRPA